MIKSELEIKLDELPEKVAEALEDWRLKTLERERVEALLYIQYAGEDLKRTATMIKAKIHSDEKRSKAVVEEIQAERKYTFLYERLLALKKEVSMRTAF